MADEIVPLLHRRGDLSTFLIHLTSDSEYHSARENLVSILADLNIEARTCYGMAKTWALEDHAVAATQRCVCFSEAPLDHAWMLTRDIVGRTAKLSEYGLVFTKSFGRRMGVNPVWYLDITPGHSWLTNSVNTLVEIAKRGKSYGSDRDPPDVGGALVSNPLPTDDPILRLVPFLEQMGRTNEGRKEFWWEREWRHVGDFRFGVWQKVVAVLAPHAEHQAIVDDLAKSVTRDGEHLPDQLKLLDPEWGLERMIAALAGVDDADAGPFPEN